MEKNNVPRGHLGTLTLKTDYVSVKEALEILGSTRQNIHYLRKHGIIKDFVQVHKTCFMYSKEELLNLKSLGYGA
jgi:hypothetical protein